MRATITEISLVFHWLPFCGALIAAVWIVYVVVRDFFWPAPDPPRPRDADCVEVEKLIKTMDEDMAALDLAAAQGLPDAVAPTDPLEPTDPLAPTEAPAPPSAPEPQKARSRRLL